MRINVKPIEISVKDVERLNEALQKLFPRTSFDVKGAIAALEKSREDERWRTDPLELMRFFRHPKWMLINMLSSISTSLNNIVDWLENNE
jgi:hypothetical protein